MVVNKQNIQVPFAVGLDTKTDPLQVPFGTLLDLENGQFIHGGSISKRYGYDVLNNQTQTNATITEGVALATYNNQLLAFDGYQLYSYVESANNWATVAPCISTVVSDTQIIRTNEATQSNPCSNTIETQDGAVQCVAWEDSRGGVYYSVLDLTTGSFLVNEQVVNASGFAPKVLVFNNLFVILYMTGDILNYQLVNPYIPLQITPLVELHTDGYYTSQYGAYDATVIGMKIFITYINQTPKVRIYSLNQAFTQSSIHSASPTLTVQNTNLCCNVIGDAAENVYVTWTDGYSVYQNVGEYNVDAGGGFYYFSPIPMETGVGRVNNITTLPLNSYNDGYVGTASTAMVFYEIYNVQTQYEQTHIATVNYGGPSIIVDVQRGVGLASKAFLYEGTAYVNIIQSSPLQATYFTMDQNQNLYTKINNEVGGNLLNNSELPEVFANSTNTEFTFTNSIKGKLISAGNIIFSPLGVNSTNINFTNNNAFLNAELSENLFIVGGILQCYDGANVTESGFHIYPENILAESFTSGGGLFQGTYQYSVVYSYTDNIGQINYSATSVPVSIVCTQANVAGFGVNSVELVIPTLKLTSKVGVTILVYRTLVNESNFYRVSSFTGIPNNENADYITFTDGASDAAIQSNDLLYTTGGTLDNIAPPACSIITTYNNRVFIAGLEDPNLIWYSQSQFDLTNANTVPIEFSNYLTVGVNSLGGPITALAASSGNLYIFKENNIYVMNGQGPDATGNNSDYQTPALVTTDTGCNNPSSMVLMPMGLMFQSPKGIYLLDVSNTPHYIGQQVEAYNNYVVTSATLDIDSNQVIFTTQNGPALVYNYFYQQWSTWTNHLTSSQGGVSFGNDFTFIKPNGLVYVQDKTSYTDAGTAISLSWQSAWISLAQIQGYQMIYKILILGQFYSPHVLNYTIDYNFGEYTESGSITPQNTPFGYGDGYYGDGYYQGEFFPYEFRINPSYKRCTSIRITVSDSQTSPNYGEGYSISNMSLEVGVLPGANRLQGNPTGNQ